MLDLGLKENLPRHIAIIMDGNGRWAQMRGKPRIWGHRMGAKTVDLITQECSRIGIQQLTLYAFSTENWLRPQPEISYLMCLLRRFLMRERTKLMENNIRLTAIGQLERLPDSVRNELEYTQRLTTHNTGMTLCLALSYGGRSEIVQLAKKLARQAMLGEIDVEKIDEKLCSSHLYQPNMPDVDLLIRTSGEMRLSNFLLWEISYAELWITPTLWPDFSEVHLHQAIREFAKRERKFGKVPSPQQIVSPV